jgi:hypothetical protein
MNDKTSSQTHRQQLEQKLLAAYDAATPRTTPSRRFWLRHTPAAAVLLILLSASQVPAGYRVELGKRIAIQFSASDPPDSAPKALVQAIGLEGEPSGSVSVQLRRLIGGPTVLIANAWGDRLPADSVLLERLRRLPEFANAQMTVTPLEGKIRDNLAGLARHLLFNPEGSPEARQRAREALIDELRRTEGNDASIDVQIDEDGPEQKVRVKVMKGPESPSSHP